jgi:hypothetical protein
MARVRLLVAASLLAGVAWSVSAAPPQSAAKKKQATQTAAAKRKALEQKRADSLAQIRADSLRRAAAEIAKRDSLRALEEQRRREDSVKATLLRTVPNKAFGAGERLVFDISYGVVTAGEAVITVSPDSVAGRACYRVDVRIYSLPSFSWIYKVEDLYVTYIDREAMVPWKFEQHIREGGYRRDFIAEFDQIAHRAKTTEGEYPIPPYVHDIMSAFFYVRTLDFSGAVKGDILWLQNFYKDRTYELGVKFLGRQEEVVEAGTFKTIVLEPMVREGGLFKSEGRIVIWLSDDDRKIPIRVNTKVVIGSIDTELREYSGLLGPVQSRVR